jgi:ribosomal protein S12 methylthiotransferase
MMRQRIPGLSLRTTFIVGYPGESNADFQLLVDFIREIEFDHLGVFPFSYESGTSSAPLGDPIPETVKLERVDQLMTLQETISLKKNQQFIGKTLDVLVEGYGDEISVGRSYRDAPEIDGLVIVEDKLPVGVISRVQVTGALKHDLIARAIPQ